MRRTIGLFLVTSMSVAQAYGQAQKPESKAPETRTPETSTVVLKAARLFDGKSNSLMTPGLVIVTGGKNFRRGRECHRAGRSGSDRPGRCDTFAGIYRCAYASDYDVYHHDKQAALDGLQKTIAEQTLDSIANAKVTLLAGFTTVRDVGSHDFMDVGLRNAIRNGKVPGPRMLVCVHAIGATGGHCDETGYRSGVFGK